jgi:hypothetical protein
MAIVALMGFAGNIISIAVLSRYCKILYSLMWSNAEVGRNNFILILMYL